LQTSSLAIGLLKKRALRRLPPSSIVRFSFVLIPDLQIFAAALAKEKTKMINRRGGFEDVQSFLFRS
jgi:hypothetical protein